MPSDGKMAEVPNAKADCFWLSVQCHTYLLRPSAREAVREMVPHCSSELVDGRNAVRCRKASSKFVFEELIESKRVKVGWIQDQ